MLDKGIPSTTFRHDGTTNRAPQGESPINGSGKVRKK